KERAPEIVAMGGGPRLTELAIKHADGFSAGAPFVFARPEEYGAAVRNYKTELAKVGRSSDSYVFGLHHIAFICKSKDDFERFVDNPLLKWYAATGGRLHIGDWAKEGLESVMPLDWRYNFDMRPASLTREEVDAVISRVPAEMVRKTFFYGTPADIAAEIIPYVKQGCNLNLIADLSPLMVETDPFHNIEQMAEVCRLIKAA
ncbi:MAG: LLM class flavin-dependent oxidoreductase, partial [Steroidobacteraceae bacterium]